MKKKENMLLTIYYIFSLFLHNLYEMKAVIEMFIKKTENQKIILNDF